MTADHDEWTDSSGKPLPCLFVSKNLYLLIYGLAIPIVFLIFLRLQLNVTPFWLADAIVDLLGPNLPLLQDYYTQMVARSDVAGATDYALFFASSLIFLVAIHVVMVRKFLARRNAIGMPNIVLDWLVFVLLGLAVYYVFSTAKVYPSAGTSHGALYVDQYGIFYFKQYLLFCGLAFSTLVLMISVLKTVQHFASGPARG